MNNQGKGEQWNGNEIAIIGMAGRFPGSRDLTTFWQNLREGVETISHFTTEELQAAGVPSALLDDPGYVRSKGILEDIDLFDAAFFGYSPREAELIDPQQRLFLECAWQALEDAGYDALSYTGLIGVYAGVNMSAYYDYILFHLIQNLNIRSAIDAFQLLLGNEKDYLTTRVSYKLNLRGPSIAVQTACSTSMVAVHLASQSLLNGECDMALAGGVSLHDLYKGGYFYREGGIASPDGHCRAFDAEANGTLSGSGLGIVVLKRLSDALADGDFIHAVIKGTACNNDGAAKIGYTAPSVQGQATVIAEAQAMADVPPETISYIEAHGTATEIGDPIEVAALTQAFGACGSQKNFCAIGSIKSNMGHLGAAAGIAGLLKTTLALENALLPPSLHFQKPNPQIDFANSPFYVNSKLKSWAGGTSPRRAGVSSFGIGGTNAHVVLQEAPAVLPGDTSMRPWYLLIWSAKTDTAIKEVSRNLALHLQSSPQPELADVAYTLQVGRSSFPRRQFLVCKDLAGAIDILATSDPARLSGIVEATERPIAFLFPGQGTQYVHMGYELYQSERVFRREVDRCADLLLPQLQLDLRAVLFPEESMIEEAAQQLQQTWLTQPALFVLEYALARLWETWGIRPQAMIGHSIGEYVAACLAGVFSLEVALQLVAARSRFMQQVENGAMLAVSLSRTQVEQELAILSAQTEYRLCIAASNMPEQFVVSGMTAGIAALEQQLQEKGIDCQRLRTSHAFHSEMVEPVLGAFRAFVKSLPLQSPQLRYISNVTGTWITAEQATDPEYWVTHMRQEVRFAEGIETLLRNESFVLLEVGPGRTLSTFARQQSSNAAPVVASLPGPKEAVSESFFITKSLGSLWQAGVKVDWSQLYIDERRLRVPLPTYPFERKRYWMEPGVLGSVGEAERNNAQKRYARLYAPIWKQSLIERDVDIRELLQQKMCWLVFLDTCGVGTLLVEYLKLVGQRVITVTHGTHYEKAALDAYIVRADTREDYFALLSELTTTGTTPQHIVHLWNLTSDTETAATTEAMPFYSLLWLAQALGEHNRTEKIRIGIIANDVQLVTGEEEICPEKALLLGPCKVIPQEYANISCHCIDIVLPDKADPRREHLIEQIIVQSVREQRETVSAYRGNHYWIQAFEPLPVQEKPGMLIREEGVYLITGGMGGIGLTLAEFLARTAHARLILVGRTYLPERTAWEQWVATHGVEDPISAKIQKIQALEAMGAVVWATSVDVTDMEQMQRLVDATYERFGAIHGVIHAAGVPGGGMLQLKKKEVAHAVLAPKVIGTRVVEHVLRERKLDFLLLCSSLSAIQGGIGQVDYCAANAFLDAFASYAARHSTRIVISVNWDAWQEVGMAVNTPLPPDLQARRKKALTSALLPEEAVEAFRRVLALRLPQVVISTAEFHADARNPRPISNIPEEPKGETGGPAHSVTTEQKSVDSQMHERPWLANAYVAPEQQLEKQIAAIWSSLLGIDKVGIDDNFFELGGHSLLATQVVARLRSQLQRDIPLRMVLEKPTIIELAIAIRQGEYNGQESATPAIAPAAQRDIEHLLANIDTLSDAEVDIILSKALEEE